MTAFVICTFSLHKCFPEALTYLLLYTQAETQDVPPVHQETFCYFEDDRLLAQVVQSSCGVSIPGNVQKPGWGCCVGPGCQAQPCLLDGPL